jgi:hypothetical protein
MISLHLAQRLAVRLANLGSNQPCQCLCVVLDDAANVCDRPAPESGAGL